MYYREILLRIPTFDDINVKRVIADRLCELAFLPDGLYRPNCFVHWPNIHLCNRSQFCKLILFIETYCAVIRGMPSSYCQEDATGISLFSSHGSYLVN